MRVTERADLFFSPAWSRAQRILDRISPPPGWCNMAGNEQRRVDADIYICEAIRVLQAVQSKHLDHSDVTTVRTALDGLRTVQRSIAGAAVPDDARVATRLGQV